MEFAKYYDVTDLFKKLMDEQPDDFCGAEIYTNMYICNDTLDFWIARVQKNINGEYETQEGVYLCEREKIDKFRWAEYMIKNEVVESFIIHRNSVSQFIKNTPVLTILKTLLIMDNSKGYDNWDYEEYSSLESIEKDIDGGFGIIRYQAS